MCFTKGLFRYALIGGLAVGGATLLIGPQRMANGFAQVRASLQDHVDEMIDDPIALRREIQALAEDYPEKIAEIRGELAEVNQQIDTVSYESDVNERVVSNTTSALRGLQDLMARAQVKEQSSGRTVRISFDHRQLDATDATLEFKRIRQTRQNHLMSYDANQKSLELLTAQRDRLADLLGKLETEFSNFKSRVEQLDRQIDAIQRNERVAEMIEERTDFMKNWDHHGKIASLNQLESKLARWNAEVEARIAALDQRTVGQSFEEAARAQVDADRFGTAIEDLEFEFTSDDQGFEGIELDDESMALGPVVINEEG